MYKRQEYFSYAKDCLGNQILEFNIQEYDDYDEMLQALQAVSYTHLDVYKRQDEHIAKPVDGKLLIKVIHKLMKHNFWGSHNEKTE